MAGDHDPNTSADVTEKMGALSIFYLVKIDMYTSS
jgi:hypothetical protein